MSYYYAAPGYEGAKTKKECRLPSHCARMRCKLGQKIMEKVRGEVEDAQRLSRAGEEKKLCVIRTKKDRTG